MEILRHLFSSGDFMPHGYCYLWNPGLVWLHVVSDILIALAYFLIPFALIKIIRNRTDLPFQWMFVAFGIFIVACGGTHAMEVWNLWHAEYWLAGVVKAITAAASVPTAILLFQLVPKAVALPSLSELKKANEARELELSERIEAEAALEASRERFRQQAELLDLAHDAIFVRDNRGVIVHWYKGAERTYGWTAKEAIGSKSAELLKTESPKPLAEIESDVSETEFWEGELVHQRRDGTRIVMGSRWAPQRDARGKITAILEINNDITARKRAEAELARWNDELEKRVAERAAELIRANESLKAEISERLRVEKVLEESESRLQALVGSIDEAVFELDADGTCLHVWTTKEEMLPLPKKDLVGRRMADIIGKELHDSFLKIFQRVLATGQGESLEYSMDVETGKRWFLSHVSPIRSPRGDFRTLCMLARDITERKALQQQLAQAQRMEAIGRLAGGMAHDFNNILGIILGFGEMISNKLTAEDPLQRHVGQIIRATQSAASLTRQLLAFSRQQVLEPKVVGLNSIVGELEKLIRLVIGEDVELSITLDPSAGFTKVDPGQIEHVIINLAANARDAMPKGGRVTIETSNADLDELYARRKPNVPPGEYVVLAVTDTGVGMDPETRARIFEPFFTTKEKGRGTGLGLASVYGIVQQSGGFIWVYSEPDRGTIFKIYLPRVEEEVATPLKPEPIHAFVSARSERVLLVEDSELLRTLLRETLESEGYSVLEAGSGVDALRLAKEYVGPIHLLITDVVMPEMGGRQLVEELTRLRPTMKVLYITGYGFESLKGEDELQPGVPVLSKPFGGHALLNRVDEILHPGALSGETHKRKGADA